MPNFRKVITFFKESKAELSKVVWPKRPDITRNTWVVILISLGVAFFLGIVDYILYRTIDQIFKPL